MDNHVVIMAGGIGSRFWPMSTPGTVAGNSGK